MSNLTWLNPTPHATAVYASCSALLPPHATLASRRPATALPGPDFHRLIAPAWAGAFSSGHLDPIILDHRVGQQLVGGLSEQRFSLPAVAALQLDVEHLALADAGHALYAERSQRPLDRL